MRGLWAGRVSARLLYREAEMFKNMAYYLRIGNETDDLHLPSTARGTGGVRPAIENRMLRAKYFNPRELQYTSGNQNPFDCIYYGEQ